MLLYLSDQQPQTQPASVQLFLPEGVTYGAISKAEPLSQTRVETFGFHFMTFGGPTQQPATFDVGPFQFTVPIGFNGELSFSGTYW